MDNPNLNQVLAEMSAEQEQKVSFSYPSIHYDGTAPFWEEPPERYLFLEPPFPEEVQEELKPLLDEFKQRLQAAGCEVEAVDLWFNYLALVWAPVHEYKQLCHKLEPQRDELEAKIEQCNQEIEKKQQAFVEQIAQAQLPLPPQPAEVVISPRLVEDALRHDFPTDEEICGQHGVTPPEKGGSWQVVGHWLLELFAPLVAGLILGVNIAVLTGFLRLEDFRRGEQMWLVALAAAIGCTIEKLVGAVWYHLARSFAQTREQQLEAEGAEPFPRLQAGWVIGVFSLFVLLLGTAVVVVDALGLRILHEQEVKRLGAQTSEVLPLWMYLMAGCVISLPYLAYKAWMGWRTAELRLRDSRIAYLHWKHIEQRRSVSAVQRAFTLAQEVVNLRNRLAWLQAQLQAVKTRLDSARTQAVGCHLLFKEYWDAMVRMLIARRGDGTQPIRHPSPLSQRDTLLRRLMRSLGLAVRWLMRRLGLGRR